MKKTTQITHSLTREESAVLLKIMDGYGAACNEGAKQLRENLRARLERQRWRVLKIDTKDSKPYQLKPLEVLSALHDLAAELRG